MNVNAYTIIKKTLKVLLSLQLLVISASAQNKCTAKNNGDFSIIEYPNGHVLGYS